MAIKWLIVLSLIVISVSSQSDKSLETKTKPFDEPSIIYNDTSGRQSNYGNGLYSSIFNFPSDEINIQKQPLELQPLNVQRKKRRRRKPKRQNIVQGNYPFGQYYPQGPYNHQSASLQGLLNQNQINTYHKRPEFGHVGHNGKFQLQSRPGFGVPQGPNNAQYKPGFSQMPTPYPGPIKQDTLSSISDALGSIAKYDDFQCVPRMLCEMASGRSPVASQGSLLSNLLNLEPLFTLMTAYNGASFSPIFSFGRAALLGMTSQGNSASCRYAYPRCPQDPDKLVDYLNNHNGGFFRFFNGGQNQPTNHQNGLSQFYDNLAGIQNNINQNYGVYQESNLGQYPHPSGQLNNAYGLNANRITFAQRNRGTDSETQEQAMFGNAKDIQARIQNSPVAGTGDVYESQNHITSSDSSQWLFPDNSKETSINNYEMENPKKNKSFKFPSESIYNFNLNSGSRTPYKEGDDKTFRKPKNVSFPNENKQYYTANEFERPLAVYDYSRDIFPIRTGTGNLKLDLNENFTPGITSPLTYTRPYRFKVSYSNQGTRIQNYENDVVYIVRGNGDPNNPEIVRVKPGQKVY